MRLTTCIALATFTVAQMPALADAAPKALANNYVLGPGDAVLIELLNSDEFNGIYSIGPDGFIYLPQLRTLKVDGLTIDELRYFLESQFKSIVKEPRVYVSPFRYRSVRVYVGGEVSRPGYYLLGKSSGDDNSLQSNRYGQSLNRTQKDSDLGPTPKSNLSSSISQLSKWPTLFDAIRSASGVTPFSDLTKVTVLRNQSYAAGRKKLLARINFLDLITNGNEEVNIKLYDGDVIQVAKSDKALRDQLLEAARTNLSPDQITVFVTGRVKAPGAHFIPQAGTLNQAIASAGGPKFLRGSVEFVRFNRDGDTDRRRFSYSPKVQAGEFKNPVLMHGDIIRVNDSLLSASVEVLNEITGPAVGIYSVYSLFKP